MKIVIISSLYAPFIRGGAELVAQRMAEGLREHLQHVSVITTRPYKNLSSIRLKRITVNDVPVYSFYPLNIYHYLNGYKFPWVIRFVWHFFDIFNAHSYHAIKKLLRELKPDVVITHNLMGIGFLIPKAIKKSGIRHIHLAHDVQLVEPSGVIMYDQAKMKKTDRKLPLYVKMMRYLFKDVDFVISPSKFLLDFYRGYGFFKNKPTKILGNPTFNISRKEGKLESNILRLLYLGQLTDSKGITGLISTILSMKEANILLKVVGIGPLMKKLVNKISGDNRVLFLGWQGRKGLENVFSNSDALVMPTLCVENSPTAVREALASGIPVIASNIGGIPELIKSDENGWLFNPGDWVQLKKIISDLARNPEKIQSASKNAKKSMPMFSDNKYIEELLMVLDTDK